MHIRNRDPFAIADIKTELVQFGIKLPGILTCELNESRQGLPIEADPHLPRPAFDERHDLVFPSGLGGIRPVMRAQIREFLDALPTRATLVHSSGAQEELHIRWELLDIVEDCFDPLGCGVGLSNLGIREEVGILQPDQLGPAEERHGLKGLHRGLHDLCAMVGILSHTIDDIRAELSAVRRSHFPRKAQRRLLHPRIVSADDGDEVVGKRSGSRSGGHGATKVTNFKSQITI